LADFFSGRRGGRPGPPSSPATRRGTCESRDDRRLRHFDFLKLLYLRGLLKEKLARARFATFSHGTREPIRQRRIVARTAPVGGCIEVLRFRVAQADLRESARTFPAPRDLASASIDTARPARQRVAEVRSAASTEHSDIDDAGIRRRCMDVIGQRRITSSSLSGIVSDAANANRPHMAAGCGAVRVWHDRRLLAPLPGAER